MAYIIDTSGKQPREHAVKFRGTSKVDRCRCVPRSRRGRHIASCCSGTKRRQRGNRYLKPTLTPRSCEVKVRIGPTEFWRTTGICGTDLHIYEWDECAQATIPVPLVIGHEFVGEIVSVGSNVGYFRPGEVVSGAGQVVCGRYRNCLAGCRPLCARTLGVGVNRWGAFAEYIVLPDRSPRR